MATSPPPPALPPPTSPGMSDRPSLQMHHRLSAIGRPSVASSSTARSNSRMSMSVVSTTASSKHGGTGGAGGSRASDEDNRTAVQVSVRVRPPLQPSDPGFDLIPQRFQRSMVQVTSPTSLAVDSPPPLPAGGGRKLFVFDRVFGPEVSQDGIWDYISESVGSFVQGYNVSVMAYGQSGAGKSYTMGTSGPAEQGDRELMGVIPRAAKALFSRLAQSSPPLSHSGSGIRVPTRYSISSFPTANGSRSSQIPDRQWQLKATYVEIYNEQLRDLLVPDSVPAHERGTVAIREDTKGKIFLTGLHQVPINSIEDLLEALNFGSMIRQTDSTAINAKSSRSHAVFSLNLVQRKGKSAETWTKDKRLSMPVDTMSGAGAQEGWITVDSKLHFVDLAGSERLKNTGASGDRAKEGISINAGLANLGKVISQLSARQQGSHVSYRDSKLTRLLQDSLGGTAITYMIACVTPAEFHLSETLNTVQYAQRARNIQIRPKIQQVSDEGDKQAIIDRLKAEIQFLRDQIRSAEGADRSGHQAQDRTERQHEKEIELQNQLLDIQESYTALSQRHAKLMSDITRAKGNDAPSSAISAGLRDSAADRLQRSTTFDNDVEQLVLEYGKTIHSLETALSNTRSSLSTSESTLLERETKCAYFETLNQQLQSRMQKLIDREGRNDRYLHDLEARLDGRAEGEERSSAIISELRKEIVRVRESESTAEEYISTLEERLAESERDSELMNQEIYRLEHVVERQRSVGKLDNLLHELDSLHPGAAREHHELLPNGIDEEVELPKEHPVSNEGLQEAAEIPIPDSEDEEGTQQQRPQQQPEITTDTSSLLQSQDNGTQSSAQSHFMQEKLETVNQELFDLRVEHEAAVNEYDLLSAKYDEALRTLVALQEAVDDDEGLPQTPKAFLANARVNDKNAGQSSSSRSLSSELSSAGELRAPQESSSFDEFAAAQPDDDIEDGGEQQPPQPDLTRDELVQQVEELKAVHAQKEQNIDRLQRNYDALHEQHLDAMDLVEELKAEVHKAKLSPPSPSSPFVRRKTSQIIASNDRANRSLATLNNIAAEHLTDRPEVRDNFELNTAALAHDLHQRSERVQALESEVAAMKKEMETKMTIISGLTRERSSLKASSPVDMNMISSMRDQVLQSERELKALHDSSVTRERELLDEIESLKQTLVAPSSNPAPMPGALPQTPTDETTLAKELSAVRPSDDPELHSKFVDLQHQMTQLEDKHKAALLSNQDMERRYLATVKDLEDALNSIEKTTAARTANLDSLSNSTAAAAVSFEKERESHEGVVEALNREIDGHKARFSELESAHAAAQKEVQQTRQFQADTQKHLDLHREQITALEEQLAQHQAAVEFHKHGLKSLHDSHAVEMEEMRAQILKEVDEEVKSRVEEATTAHRDELKKLGETADERKRRQSEEHRRQLEETRRQLEESQAVIGGLRKENVSHSRSASTATDELKEARSKLRLAESAQAAAEAQLTQAQSRVQELTATRSELNDELAKVREREQRASRLVEELEVQLNSNFEDSRNTTSRLSLLQSAREQELAEAKAATHKAQEETAVLRNRIESLEAKGRISPTDQSSERANSLSSTLRKTMPVTGLPSPPPAIPLPPLPSGAIAAATSTSAQSNNPSPISPVAASSPNLLKDSSNPSVPGAAGAGVGAGAGTGAAGTPTTAAAAAAAAATNAAAQQRIEEQDTRIRTIEKHLFAEKQLTATLEEALADLESQVNKVKGEMEGWRKKAWEHEDELASVRKESSMKAERLSMQKIEEERKGRMEAEAARAHLEERMAALHKKKKKSALNCF